VNSTSDGRSFVAFDFDHDGDQDIVIASTNAPAQLFLNRWADRIQNHWLKLRLLDGRGHEVPGVMVKVHTGKRVQAKTSSFSNGYLSSYVGPMLFGLGKATRVDLIEVLWPDGSSSHLENVRADEEIELRPNSPPTQ